MGPLRDPPEVTRRSRRIRVAHVIDELVGGGAQAQLYELLRAINRDAFEVSLNVLSTEKDVYSDRLRRIGIDPVLIPQRGKWDQRAFQALQRSFRSSRPDIVQTWLFTADLYGRLAAWSTGVRRTVSSVRSTSMDKPRHHVWVDRLLAPFTTQFTVNARAVGLALSEREWVSNRRIVTIYNGIDVERFVLAKGGRRKWRERWGWGDEVPVAGYVGRLRQEKRPDLFLAAAQLVLERLPSARLVMVGEGPQRAQVEEAIRRGGFGDRLRLERFAPDVERLLSAIDLLVLPSDYEGCSNVILEAMASSRAVVATAVGGNPELVEPGVTGWLVAPGDASALGAMVVEALSDRERLSRMGAAGRRRIDERYSVRSLAERHEELYRSLVRDSARPAFSAMNT